MSRLEEVEAEIISADGAYHDSAWIGPESLRHLARTLAAEVDKLRGKLADWEVAAQQGHPSPCTLGSLCPYCEIERLRGKLADANERCMNCGDRLDEQDGHCENCLARALQWGELVRAHDAEIAELRGKLDDVRMGIGCARGQRSTQFCAEAAQRDDVITKLLDMLKPEKRHWKHAELDTPEYHAWCLAVPLYARACEIAGRTE